MTAPDPIEPRVDQVWARKVGGRRVRVAYVMRDGQVRLAPLDHGHASWADVATLRRDFDLVSDPGQGDWWP